MKNYRKAFDNPKLRGYYKKFLDMKKRGEIKDLKKYPKFEIVPKLVKATKVMKNGRELLSCEVVERAAYFVADFQYTTQEGNYVVVKVLTTKSRNEAYVLSRKLLRHRFDAMSDDEHQWYFDEVEL